jgi:hypothetical protein
VKECAICMEDLTHTTSTCSLQCHSTHTFHSQCIKDWFHQQGTF